MADIPQQVLQGLKQIATETGEKALQEAGKIGETVISGKELLGDIKPLTPEELQKKKNEDEIKKQQELGKIGRNVEMEIKQIRSEKENKQSQEDQLFLKQLEQQREAERIEREQLAMANGVSANPAKRRKSRGSALVQGKKKSQQPDMSQTSATSEFKGGKID